MIAHVAQAGEQRGRVVLQVSSPQPSAMALAAAIRVARAFNSELESLFIEDAQLFDCAAYGFVREVSISGRSTKPYSAGDIAQSLQLAAQSAHRQLEALAKLAEVPLRTRVVRDQPLAAFHRTMAVNYLGALHLVRAALPEQFSVFDGTLQGSLKQASCDRLEFDTRSQLLSGDFTISYAGKLLKVIPWSLTTKLHVMVDVRNPLNSRYVIDVGKYPGLIDSDKIRGLGLGADDYGERALADDEQRVAEFALGEEDVARVQGAALEHGGQR